MTARRLDRSSATLAGGSLALAALVSGGVAPAHGGQPVRIPIDEAFTLDMPFCGVDAHIEGRDWGTMTIRTSGPGGIAYVSEHLRGEVFITNVATQATVHLTRGYRPRDQRIVDNGDGTLTVIFRGTYNETDYAPDGSVAFRSAGQDTVRLVVDDNGTPGDPDDDVVLSEDYLGFTGHDGRAGTDFCQWFVDVTTP